MRHAVMALGMVVIGLCLRAATTGQDGGGVRTRRADGAVVVSSGDREVLCYQLERPADSKLPVESGCYFHPLRTPAGTVVTDVAPADHLHHRGVFLAWFEMKGKKDADFWGWGAHAPVKDRRIVNREVKETASGFVARNEWLAEGAVLLVEELDAKVADAEVADAAAGTERRANVVDLTYTLTPDANLTLPRRAFSGFCVRVPVGAKVEAFGPDGLVSLPDPHHEKPDTGWPAARWYAYGLSFDDGKLASVAVIDHPKNPPSLWHNHRDVRMLNPCVVAPGPVTIKANEPLVLRYRVVTADGQVPTGLLNRLAGERDE